MPFNQLYMAFGIGQTTGAATGRSHVGQSASNGHNNNNNGGGGGGDDDDDDAGEDGDEYSGRAGLLLKEPYGAPSQSREEKLTTTWDQLQSQVSLLRCKQREAHERNEMNGSEGSFSTGVAAASKSRQSESHKQNPWPPWKNLQAVYQSSSATVNVAAAAATKAEEPKHGGQSREIAERSGTDDDGPTCLEYFLSRLNNRASSVFDAPHFTGTASRAKGPSVFRLQTSEKTTAQSTSKRKTFAKRKTPDSIGDDPRGVDRKDVSRQAWKTSRAGRRMLVKDETPTRTAKRPNLDRKTSPTNNEASIPPAPMHPRLLRVRDHFMQPIVDRMALCRHRKHRAGVSCEKCEASNVMRRMNNAINQVARNGPISAATIAKLEEKLTEDMLTVERVLKDLRVHLEPLGAGSQKASPSSSDVGTKATGNHHMTRMSGREIKTRTSNRRAAIAPSATAPEVSTTAPLCSMSDDGSNCAAYVDSCVDSPPRIIESQRGESAKHPSSLAGPGTAQATVASEKTETRSTNIDTVGTKIGDIEVTSPRALGGHDTTFEQTQAYAGKSSMESCEADERATPTAIVECKVAVLSAPPVQSQDSSSLSCQKENQGAILSPTPSYPKEQKTNSRDAYYISESVPPNESVIVADIQDSADEVKVPSAKPDLGSALQPLVQGSVPSQDGSEEEAPGGGDSATAKSTAQITDSTEVCGVLSPSNVSKPQKKLPEARSEALDLTCHEKLEHMNLGTWSPQVAGISMSVMPPPVTKFRKVDTKKRKPAVVAPARRIARQTAKKSARIRERRSSGPPSHMQPIKFIRGHTPKYMRKANGQNGHHFASPGKLRNVLINTVLRRRREATSTHPTPPEDKDSTDSRTIPGDSNTLPIGDTAVNNSNPNSLPLLEPRSSSSFSFEPDAISNQPSSADISGREQDPIDTSPCDADSAKSIKTTNHMLSTEAALQGSSDSSGELETHGADVAPESKRSHELADENLKMKSELLCGQEDTTPTTKSARLESSQKPEASVDQFPHGSLSESAPEVRSTGATGELGLAAASRSDDEVDGEADEGHGDEGADEGNADSERRERSRRERKERRFSEYDYDGGGNPQYEHGEGSSREKDRYGDDDEMRIGAKRKKISLLQTMRPHRPDDYERRQQFSRGSQYTKPIMVEVRRRAPLEVLAACAAPFEKKYSSSAMAKLLVSSGMFSAEELAGGLGAGASRGPQSPQTIGRGRSHLMDRRKRAPYNNTHARTLLEACSYVFRER